jgi:hypothetical protein
MRGLTTRSRWAQPPVGEGATAYGRERRARRGASAPMAPGESTVSREEHWLRGRSEMPPPEKAASPCRSNRAHPARRRQPRRAQQGAPSQSSAVPSQQNALPAEASQAPRRGEPGSPSRRIRLPVEANQAPRTGEHRPPPAQHRSPLGMAALSGGERAALGRGARRIGAGKALFLSGYWGGFSREPRSSSEGALERAPGQAPGRGGTWGETRRGRWRFSGVAA